VICYRTAHSTKHLTKSVSPHDERCFDWSNADYDQFEHCLQSVDWQMLISQNPNASDSYTAFVTHFVTSLMCVCATVHKEKIIPTNLFLSHGNHEQYVGAPLKNLSCGTSSKPDHTAISSSLNTVSVANCGVHLSVIRKLHQNYE